MPTQPSAAPEQAYTVEPWEICGATHIWSPAGKANVASASEPRGRPNVGYEYPNLDGGGLYEAAANAKRIVACVNACAGLNPAALPDAIYCLGQIIASLPMRRDWLDPEIEARAKAALAQLTRLTTAR